MSTPAPEKLANEIEDSDIAIVGMALRVPGASNPEEYWANLCEAVESLQHYSADELRERGVSQADLDDPNYVRSGMPLAEIDQFDPDFFGFSAKEAAILDPQHRQFYQVAWEALERAGHSPKNFDGAIGVFAGCGMGAYFARNLLTNADLLDSVGLFLLRHTGNDKDFLSTRVSYTFDLTGPSVNVQTACSTSLVAAHLGVQSLLTGECDLALAGGVTIELPAEVGYHYKEGEILSPDGHCRPFDHRSKGTIFGSGAGVVVLRRLADAIADGDHIHAVIKGSAINNDGSRKVGYLAPSIEGQASAIAEALAVADVDADTLGYVECHGTGTPVGDPIEVAAMTRAFRQTTDRSGYCRIGSVKSNIGHLDTAAGVASLIKASLALEHGMIPPSLNFEAPNPGIEFASSPFVVADQLAEFPRGAIPRRAGVNSLGVGGTNAFVVLQEPPKTRSPQPEESPQLLILSARNKKSLDRASESRADWLGTNPDKSLADVSHTLINGRTHFDVRRVLACQDAAEAVRLLREPDARRVFTATHDIERPSVVFMYPGGGAQYIRMGLGLYESEPVFRAEMDRGLELLRSRFGVDISHIYFARDLDKETVNAELAKPSVQLPLTFLVEYALTRLWEHWGVVPGTLIGHSMGENTAACVAGVFSFTDALGLVLLRGQLMDGVPEGGMLSVSLPAEELQAYLGSELDLAAANSPQLSIASGPVAKLDLLAEKLERDGVESQRVKINIAAHSRMLDGITERFREYLQSITLHAPTIPIISNRTGDWLDPADAQSPDYWVGHLRNTVQFSDGLNCLLEEDDRVFLEVGPGAILGSFTRQHQKAPTHRVFGSLRHPEDTVSDDVYFRTVVGRLFAAGVDCDMSRLWNTNRQRIPLPTYEFQNSSYWIDAGTGGVDRSRDNIRPQRIEDSEQWFQQPRWVQHGILDSETTPKSWLVFKVREPIGDCIVEHLRSQGHTVVTVVVGDAFSQIDEFSYSIAPEAGGGGYQQLFEALEERELLPERIVHGWLLTWDQSFRPGSTFFHRNHEYGFYSLFYLARAISRSAAAGRELDIVVLANGAQRVAEEACSYPDKSTALGPCLVIPRELPGVTCRFVDIDLTKAKSKQGKRSGKEVPEEVPQSLAENVLAEIGAVVGPEESVVAWRDNVRWRRHVGKPDAQSTTAGQTRLKIGGVYLISGGLGGIATALAGWLAKRYAAKLVLIGRTPLPAREEWVAWQSEHAPDDRISQMIRAIEQIEAAGAEVLPIAADVTVAEQMNEAIDEAVERFGRIDGVYHAAGTVRDNLIAMKSEREIEEVFAAKVYGTLVLDSVLAERSLDFMVLFSSTSALIAPQGQIDYVGANSFLNAFAAARRGQRAYPITAVNWGIWNDVGMVAPPPSPGQTAQLDGPDTTNARMSQSEYAFFDSRYSSRQGVVSQDVFAGSFGADDDWLLNEHRLASGEALLPGTGYIELFRAAFCEVSGDRPFRISNLVFHLPFYVPDGQRRDFRVRVLDDHVTCKLALFAQSLSETAADDWVLCAEADADSGEIEFPEDICLEDIETRCREDVSAAGRTGSIRTSQEAHLNFGRRWQVLRKLAFGEGEALAELTLDDDFRSDLEATKLHPGLLDIATGCAMNLIPGYADHDVAQHLWVPIAYSGFRYCAPLQQNIKSWIKVSRGSSLESGFASFDVVLADESNKVLAVVEHLQLRRLDGPLDVHAAAQEVQTNAEGSPKAAERAARSPGEQALEHNIAQGIKAVEGTAALERLLSGPMPPEMAISSMKIDALRTQLDTIAELAGSSTETKFDRPELDSEFEAPRNGVEKKLAEIWEQLLGVEGVGIHDSFMDLGGHSLIAVRLFNEIDKSFGIDLPMSVLMQSPTVAALAELIGVDEDAEDSSADAGSERVPALQYQYVVPMHAGAVGSATPLFVVAGMFGNVLNLSHLAHLLGEDRPFYAIQARGLFGDAAPHETFEEMAADYIAEIKKVQPVGPYLLGGFSGGGITAFEIARQLLAAGDDVLTVMMLDTPVRVEPEKFSILDRCTMFIEDFGNDGVEMLKEKIGRKFGIIPDSSNPYSGHAEAADADAVAFQSNEIGNAFIRALGSYDMPKLPLDIALFRPKLPIKYRLRDGRLVNDERNYVSDDNGWSPYVAGLEIFEVPGNHDSMVLEPNVRVLVAAVNRHIMRVEQEGRQNHRLAS